MLRPCRTALLASTAALALALTVPSLSAQDADARSQSAQDAGNPGQSAQDAGKPGQSAQDTGGAALTGDLEAEIARLDEEIAKARSAEDSYTGGALGAIAALNTRTLELTRSLLEARLAAEETGAPIEITVPAVQPDPARAEEIAAEMETQKGRVEAARAEAEGARGLMAALALTRYETERMTLVQLRQAWLRARYGIALPTTGSPDTPPAPASTASTTSTTSTATTSSTSSATPTATGGTTGGDAGGNTGEDSSQGTRIAWADPDHPEIDYSASVFSWLEAGDFEITGWWGVEYSAAPLDDSPQVFALNVSDYGSEWASENPTLKAGCIEGQARVIFDADDYLLTDSQTYSIPVTVRIDSAPAVQMSWSTLTDNSGAGLFGPEAEQMMRELRDAEGVFLRLRERNGAIHDLRIDLAGAPEVFGAVAEACRFSLLDLSRDDYRAVQSLLNAGGFEAGTPDGVWGEGSRSAMSAYQKANGLEETGIPDPATLAAMGIATE